MESTSTARGSFGRSTIVIQIPCPLSEAQRRPLRPRPAAWRSARITVPAGASTAASPWASSMVDAVESNTTTRGTSSSRASEDASRWSYVAISATTGEQREDQRAKRQTIHGKHTEAVTADVPQQHGDREPAADARREHPGEQRWRYAFGPQQVGHLEERRRCGDRHAHEETEYSGALAIETQRSPGRHRGSGPRYTRHERQHLCEPDQHRVTEAQRRER